jgi:hypothetical protein
LDNFQGIPAKPLVVMVLSSEVLHKLEYKESDNIKEVNFRYRDNVKVGYLYKRFEKLSKGDFRDEKRLVDCERCLVSLCFVYDSLILTDDVDKKIQNYIKLTTTRFELIFEAEENKFFLPAHTNTPHLLRWLIDNETSKIDLNKKIAKAGQHCI